MRKIVIAAMSTIGALVLLFSYHTSTNSQAAGTTGPDAGRGNEPQSPAGSTPHSSAAPTTPASSGTGGSSGVYTGASVQTRWGAVQVQITVKDGRIAASDAVRYPTESPRDQQINAYAVPQLNAEVVEAQSAQIDAVSGATVTSDGYIESLQSAIDQAHLK